jgi:hypothetical protein
MLIEEHEDLGHQLLLRLDTEREGVVTRERFIERFAVALQQVGGAAWVVGADAPVTDVTLRVGAHLPRLSAPKPS